MTRRLVHFTALAVIWLVLQAALAPRPRLAVVVPPGADADRAIDEAVLLAEAERLGWVETDLVIRRHLVKVYGEATGQTDLDPSALFEEARALGLVRSDRVVRSRLLDRAHRALRTVPPPDRSTLAAHLAAHPERFVTEPRYTVSLRVVRRREHGDTWPDVVAETARQLAEVGDAPTDRLPMAVRTPTVATEGRLRSRLGDAVALTITGAEPHVWKGPIVLGDVAWFVRVDAVVAGQVPPLAHVRAAVRADWAEEQGEVRATEVLQSLRRRWRVDVVTP